MSLEELYRLKGDLITQLEIAQSKLQEVNKRIAQILNDINPATKEEISVVETEE